MCASARRFSDIAPVRRQGVVRHRLTQSARSRSVVSRPSPRPTAAASRICVIATQPAVGPKFSRARCRKHGAAAAGDARTGVVVDLDDEIVEVVVAHQPVAALARPAGPAVVMAVAGSSHQASSGRIGRTGRKVRGRGAGRRATTIAADGRCRAGCRRRPRACWPGCRRAQAPPGWSGRPAVSQPRRGSPAAGRTRIAASGRSRGLSDK